MIRRAGVAGLNSCAKEVLYAIEDERGVIHSVNMRAEKVARHLVTMHQREAPRDHL